MLGAFGYLLISGAAFATVRSYLMISIMFLAVMLDRPALALRNVALAAFAILLVWPESLFDPGFQMLFAAVVALVSAYEWVRRREDEEVMRRPRWALRTALLFLGGIVLSTLVASLAVAPFGIYHFHKCLTLNHSEIDKLFQYYEWQTVT
jgi:competence protein ComEC